MNFREYMGKDAKRGNFIVVANKLPDDKGWMADYMLDCYPAARNQDLIDKIAEKGHKYVQSDVHVNHKADGSVQHDFLSNKVMESYGFPNAEGKNEGALFYSEDGKKAIAFVSGTIEKGKTNYHIVNPAVPQGRPFLPKSFAGAEKQAAHTLAAQDAMKAFKEKEKAAAKEATAEAPAVEAKAEKAPKTERRMPKGVEEIAAKEASAEISAPEL